ncbi:MAG: hypothetical protein IT517_19940 [Burkholderiales bacterium]|nr:hypothetical protein [Burkholderiales bacterium]
MTGLAQKNGAVISHVRIGDTPETIYATRIAAGEASLVTKVGEAEARVAAAFEGDYRLTFNLAPPIFNKPDPVTGVPKKTAYGPWMMMAFRMLAKMRKYRGSALDVFGRTGERRMERRLIVEYEKVVDEILGRLTPQNHATAVELASIPEHIRGYGHVKEAQLKTAKTCEAALLAFFRAPAPAAKPAVVKVVV